MKPGFIALAVILLLLAAGAAVSQGGYDLSWWTVDGGGGTLGGTGGEGYRLTGSLGQPDAGSLAGDGYVLAGGFWPGLARPAPYQVYLPLLVRNTP